MDRLQNTVSFLTENTIVEWSFVSFYYKYPLGNTVRHGSFLSTSHLRAHEKSCGKILSFKVLCEFDIILHLHNHPSGSAKPSRADLETAEVIEKYSTNPIFKLMSKGHPTIIYNMKYPTPDIEEAIIKP